MRVTYPMALADDNIWIFAQYDHDGAIIDAFRLGVHVREGAYGTFPPDLWHTDGILPVSRRTGEPDTTHRWATVADLANNAKFPGFRYVEL